LENVLEFDYFNKNIYFREKYDNMTKMPQATKFTSLQLELLKIYSYSPTEEELLDVKDMLAKYFLRKAIAKIGEIEKQRGTTNEDLDRLLEDENQ
jgi:hypothetical protein